MSTHTITLQFTLEDADMREDFQEDFPEGADPSDVVFDFIVNMFNDHSIRAHILDVTPQEKHS